MIGRGDFNRRRKVEDDALIPCPSFAPSGLHGFTDFQGKFRLGLSKGLRAVFILEDSPVFRCAFLCQLSDKLRVFRGQLNRFLLRVSEHNVTERWRCCIVHVNDGMFGTSDRIDGATD